MGITITVSAALSLFGLAVAFFLYEESYQHTA